ncbi:DoxX family membrane protein [Phocoenobacter skyensis]|uniref:DoxX family membrane protein n=1 Tax=Phocoenobacter skyensis TaxID=97481 RepID=A0ABT9JIY8_9PAST|nr:DoxX family membrane protein [Pasteurella skyensis]MDP8078911.1 DoxX family membrane protein [Pasteurella skyensis]MDP8084776.1 DoxX family membrane protein [Pasteurella skyensis]
MQKIKQYTLIFLRYVLVIFMINAGIQHFLKVDFYMPFVPRFLPFTEFFVYFSAVIEIILGVLLALGLIIFALMVKPLPLGQHWQYL